jgi:NADH:ubiquinone oxidoreductase subunit E
METTISPVKARKFSKICEIVDAHGRDKTKLIPILQQVQEQYR